MASESRFICAQKQVQVSTSSVLYFYSILTGTGMSRQVLVEFSGIAISWKPIHWQMRVGGSVKTQLS